MSVQDRETFFELIDTYGQAQISRWINEKLQIETLAEIAREKEYTESITSSYGAVCFNCSVGVCENKCYEAAEQLALETDMLKKNQLKRMAAYNKHKKWIDDLTLPTVNGKKPKYIRLRKTLQLWLPALANTTYETEQKEYEAVGKFDNKWYGYVSAFNFDDKEIFLKIANAFGAFDY
tara:strand:+ start:355 stop:888 length:534 start_codon:yes stop_codon:yes gene_type:complete